MRRQKNPSPSPVTIAAASLERRLVWLRSELARGDVRSVPQLAEQYRLEVASILGDQGALEQLKERC